MIKPRPGQCLEHVVAASLCGGIGHKNGLLYSCKEDMQHFINVTRGNSVVMGLNTALSLPRELKNRKCYVLTTWPCLVPKWCTPIRSIDSVPASFVQVIGGSQLYAATLEYVSSVWLTLMHNDPLLEPDAFYPLGALFDRAHTEAKSGGVYTPFEYGAFHHYIFKETQ